MIGFLTRLLASFSLTIIVVAVAACDTGRSTSLATSPTATAAATTVSPATPVATVPVSTPAASTPIPTVSQPTPAATVAVSPTVTANPTETAAPQLVSEATPPETSIGGSPPYLDNRSDGVEVIRSYYNAINRKEYDRAYSYWEPAAAASQIPPYNQFKQGYANTASVELSTGATTVGAGAGNLYFRVPTAIVARTTTGQTQTFVGCYTLHLGQPSIQDLPPYQPLAIQAANLKPVANNVDTSTLLAQACPTQ